MKTAIVTGVTGQDGSYAADLLQAKGYRVVGTSRRQDEAAAAEFAKRGIDLVEWDLRDQETVTEILASVRPAEFYNFAAYSTGSGMFDDPVGIGDINGLAVTRILEAIRRTDPSIRFCQASSSELFGEPLQSPQNETTPFNPRSPYGAAKLYGHAMIDIYRKRYGLFASSAILFNHESPYRPRAFVTRKITHAVASIKLGLANTLALGNLEARRDWGFAGDYVLAMQLMLQADRPADYVIATGETHSVRELCELAFGHVGLDYRDFVQEDPQSFRQEESRQLVGDPSRAAEELGWTSQLSFPDLIRMMVDADVERLSRSAC